MARIVDSLSRVLDSGGRTHAPTPSGRLRGHDRAGGDAGGSRCRCRAAAERRTGPAGSILAGASSRSVLPRVNGGVGYLKRELPGPRDAVSPGVFIPEWDDGRVAVGNGDPEAHWVHDDVRARALAAAAARQPEGGGSAGHRPLHDLPGRRRRHPRRGRAPAARLPARHGRGLHRRHPQPPRPRHRVRREPPLVRLDDRPRRRGHRRGGRPHASGPAAGGPGPALVRHGRRHRPAGHRSPDERAAGHRRRRPGHRHRRPVEQPPRDHPRLGAAGRHQPTSARSSAGPATSAPPRAGTSPPTTPACSPAPSPGGSAARRCTSSAPSVTSSDPGSAAAVGGRSRPPARQPVRPAAWRRRSRAGPSFTYTDDNFRRAVIIGEQAAIAALKIVDSGKWVTDPDLSWRHQPFFSRLSNIGFKVLLVVDPETGYSSLGHAIPVAYTCPATGPKNDRTCMSEGTATEEDPIAGTIRKGDHLKSAGVVPEDRVGDRDDVPPGEMAGELVVGLPGPVPGRPGPLVRRAARRARLRARRSPRPATCSGACRTATASRSASATTSSATSSRSATGGSRCVADEVAGEGRCAQLYADGWLDHPDAVAGTTCKELAEDPPRSTSTRTTGSSSQASCRYGQALGEAQGHYEETNSAGWDLAVDVLAAVGKLTGSTQPGHGQPEVHRLLVGLPAAAPDIDPT